MIPSLNNVLETIINVVDIIKTRHVKTSFFQKLFEAEHTALLFYCNSSLLSKGDVLVWVFKLREKLYTFDMDMSYGGGSFWKFVRETKNVIIPTYTYTFLSLHAVWILFGFCIIDYFQNKRNS